jgi:hypothetical protein
MQSPSSRSIPHSTRLLLFVALIPVITLLAGCIGSASSTSKDLKMAPMSVMPIEVKNAPVTVQEAYQFAVANPDALKNVPCYCGCGKVGHTSNYSCYIKEVKPSGEIVFDQHALFCSICVDIARDVMKMTKDGKSNLEIRSAIDQTYSQYGVSNMEPVN